jgi:hypothetical protein
MRNPHSVRLDGPNGPLHITHRVSDLEFTNIENGGFGSGSFTLQRPISRKQLDLYVEALIFDTRTGKQVSGGPILTPGRSSSDQGQVSNISFLGEGPSAMGAVERPYFLVDQTLENNFYKNYRSTKRLDVSIGNYPVQSDDEGTLFCDVTEGVVVTANSAAEMTSRLPTRCGQRLGSFGFKDKAGISNSNWRIRAYALSFDRSVVTTVVDDPWSTTISPYRVVTAGADFTNRYDVLFGFTRISTDSPTTTEDYWATVRDYWVRAQLYGQDGALRTSGLTVPYVLAGEAFVDWCVQNCPTFDMANASIAPGTYQFDQLAWPDGIDGPSFMDELLKFDQALMWGVFEKQTNGKYRTELVERSTEIRYELSIEEGYEDAGAGDELCNVVYVVWTSKAGRPQMTRVPSSGVASVPELDARGGVPQSKVLKLSEEVSSTAQAVQRGQAYLDSHAAVPNGGKLEIGARTRVRDLWTGRMVAPWEILPGYVCRVSGLSPRTDSLNPVGSPDGHTLVRPVSMNWSDSRSTAQLQLDAYPLDQYHLIADLMQKRR